MRKMYFLILLFLFIPFSVDADSIYNIDMDIYIDEYGNANVTEIWDVKADSGSEWYKEINNMGNSMLSNFVVYMDGNKLKK